MSRRAPRFTLGIEEEYLLIDRQTRDVVADPPRRVFEEAAAAGGTSGQVLPELLRAQIEVDTQVCREVAEAGEELADLRRAVATAAAAEGMAPIAASTHPFGRWQEQRHTDKARYRLLARGMQSLARRMLICGMHVHVGLEDDDMRIALMNQVRHFLPLLLALSTSSPFWEGQRTGLMSYRIPVWDTFPRTGLPDRIEGWSGFCSQVDTLAGCGIIPDGTMIWWDIRPSVRFPTVELRIPDVCTRLDDALAIAALYQCLLRYLWRLRKDNLAWLEQPRFMIEQNRWRAVRYGVDEGLIDFARREIRPVPELLAELLERLRPDARALGCSRELEHLERIPEQGTSAHRQLAIFDAAVTAGCDPLAAQREVVDWLVEATVAR